MCLVFNMWLDHETNISDVIATVDENYLLHLLATCRLFATEKGRKNTNFPVIWID